MIYRSLLYLHQLRRNLQLPTSELQEIQQKKLRAMIKHAYENVHFYHLKFDEADVKPNDIKSVADLRKLPIVTKQEIQSAEFGDIVAKNIDLCKCTKRSTSGSTGIPLTLFFDQDAEDYENAVWARAFSENGLKFYEKMAVITDPRGFPESRFFQRFGLMHRRYVSIFDSAEKQFEILQNYRPEAIKGYPSSLFILADAYKNDSRCLKPRLVFTSAELLDQMTRSYLNSVFGTSLLDNYGCNEFGLLAWECQAHEGYHINIDRAVVEFIADGEPVQDSEQGDIVCTSLVNKAMPLIRYRTDDVGTPINEKCSCGKSLPIMKIMQGRKDDFIVATDGRMFSPTVFFPYPFENLNGIIQFKVVQAKRNEINIEIAVNKNFVDNQIVFEKARAAIQRVFGEDMQVHFQICDIIQRNPNGKLRKVISCVH